MCRYWTSEGERWDLWGGERRWSGYLSIWERKRQDEGGFLGRGGGWGWNFGDSRAEERAHEELEALEFRLCDDETEIGLGVHVSCLLFDQFNLRLEVSKRCTLRKASPRCTCRRILSRTRSISESGHGRSSGALRSLTQARVNSCKSRAWSGTELPSTSANMSSISIRCPCENTLGRRVS